MSRSLSEGDFTDRQFGPHATATRHNETGISGDPAPTVLVRAPAGVTMRSDVAPTTRAVVGLAVLLGGRAYAQDASSDRANLEAAAGRLVFENVLLADPQAFARRTPVRTRDQARTTALAAPASTGDASADRETFDVSAGRATFRGRGAESAVPPMRRTEVAQASGKRSVRVILASPYGQ
jgi:mitochondrial fission protein ELM1